MNMNKGNPSPLSPNSQTNNKVPVTGATVQTKVKSPIGVNPKHTRSSVPKSGKSSIQQQSSTKTNGTIKVGIDLDATRSANDKKHYRSITLDNGLECLLISTIDAPESKVGVEIDQHGSITIPSSIDMAVNETEGHTDSVNLSRPPSMVREFASSRNVSNNGSYSSLKSQNSRSSTKKHNALNTLGLNVPFDPSTFPQRKSVGKELATNPEHETVNDVKPRKVRPGMNRTSTQASKRSQTPNADQVRPTHERVDSTTLAVEQIHAHAYSTSQLNLNAEAAVVVENAAAAAAAKVRPKFIKRHTQGSEVTHKHRAGRLIKSTKLGSYSSLSRDQAKHFVETKRNMNSRRRGSSRSVGSAILGQPAAAKADERIASMGNRRKSIPSMKLSSKVAGGGGSSAALSNHLPKHKACSHHTSTLSIGSTGSTMNLFDVPHLDHTNKPKIKHEKQSSSFVSLTGTVGGSEAGEERYQPKEMGLRMAAVSLAVGVGSFSTPEGFDGLAHFLEHMLFMGSEKFPTENAFDAFLAKAGGNSNAYTDTEKTVYHFTCPQEHLEEALDIFAQFFISPLLLPEAADRELKSIESEFTLRQNMDGCRLQEIWRHTSRKETPFSKFTCGTKQTLDEWPRAAGKDVNKALWDFYKKYYVAPNMRLCILGIDSLDELQRITMKLFSAVRAQSSFQPVDFSEHGVPWVGTDPSVQSLAQVWPQIIKAQRESKSLPAVLSQLETERNRERKKSNAKSVDKKASTPVTVGENGVALGCLFRIVPVQDMHELSLTWQLPPLAGLYMSKPTDYISHLIGHESAGSILAEAKSRGWATALVASSTGTDGFEHNTACTMFNINITLTRQGLNEWVYVVGMVFEYIGMLIRLGPQKWVHDELRKVSKMQYAFQEEPDALMLAQNLSVWMLPQSKYKPEHVLTGPWIHFEWDPVLITNTLQQLSPKLVRVDLMSSVYGHSDEYAGKRAAEADDLAVADELSEPQGKQKSKNESKRTKRSKKKKTVRFSTEAKGNEPEEEKSPRKKGEDKSSRNSKEVRSLSEKPTGAPLVEPFTGAQYWADKIPSSIINLWKELFLGRATVGFTESNSSRSSKNTSSTNSFPRSLALPARNPYISTKFDLKKAPSKGRHHPLTGATIKVNRPVSRFGSVDSKHAPGAQQRSSMLRNRLTKRKTGDFQWVNCRILDFNEDDNSILVKYPLGEYRWHDLPQEKVDWHSVPSPSAKRVSLLRKLVLDKTLEFQLVHLGSAVSALSDMSFESLESPRFRKTSLLLKDAEKRNTEEESVLDVSFGSQDTFGPLSLGAPIDGDDGFSSFPVIPTKSKNPAMVANSDNLFTLWYLHDQEFLIPRCEVYLNFVSPVANASPLLASLHDLLALMIFESLNQDSYMAFISELELEIETSGTGLQVHVGGFSHKLPVLLDNVLNKLLQFGMLDREPEEVTNIVKFDDSKSDTSKLGTGAHAMTPLELVESPVFYAQLESLVMNYINAGSQFRSSGQVSTAMFQILCRDLWSPDIKVTCATYITPDLLKEYAVKFLSECRVQGLIYGNVTLKEAQKTLYKVKDALNAVGMHPIAENEIPVLNIMKVPVSPPLEGHATISGYVHVLEALESPAHSVELYFQIGDDVLEDRLLACTIEQVMKEPFYAELRTRQQLGYSVKCGVRSICGTLGYVIEITSEVHGPELLTQDVDNFLTIFRTMLAEMPQKALNENISALARNLLEKENGLGESALKFWSTVTNKQYQKPQRYAWNYEVEQVKSLKSVVTRERLLRAYDKWLNPASNRRRRLSVMVVGYGYDTTSLFSMLDLPCVTVVESSQEGAQRNRTKVPACKPCTVM